MPDTVAKLEAQREQILSRMTQLGDMRKGSISETFRTCGKPACVCRGTDHPGHGPYYAFTRKVAGKTNTVQLRPGPRLDRFQGEVKAYKRFRALCEELVEVNEAICEARAESGQPSAPKKTSRRSSRKRSSGR
jgi:hypothetical protein